MFLILLVKRQLILYLVLYPMIISYTNFLPISLDDLLRQCCMPYITYAASIQKLNLRVGIDLLSKMLSTSLDLN